ncbi:MAG: peptidylprolyl isomerase [Thermoguttaceae bacterium]|nr:peptidylprolyl isomerase [Thermoguttaceae bacterium]
MKYALRFLAFVPVVLLAGMIFAQNTQAQAADDPLVAEFQAKFAAYREVSAQIEKLQQDFEAAAKAQDQAKIKEIQASARTILKQAETTFMNAVPVASALYAKTDGTNDELNQFMLTYANYLLTVDNYDAAYQLFASFLSKGMHKNHPEIFEMAGVAAFGSNRFNAAKKCFNYATQTKTPLSQQAQMYRDDITNYYEKEWMLEVQKEQQEAQANNLPEVLIRTTAGDMKVVLYENEAPNTVASFITLVEKGFYNGLSFHRVLPGFMAQGGCPKGDGTGDAGYKLPEEFSKPGARKHFRGSLAMARSMDPNSAGSQFYISFLPTKFLDGQYTVFGRVVEGLDTLSNIQRVDPERPIPGLEKTKIIEMRVLRKRNHDYSNFRRM